MVEKQGNLHQNEPDYGNAFLFLSVQYKFNSFAFCGFVSTALDNNDLKGL